MAGVAAMVRAGARVIFDDVFLGGAASQERMRGYDAGVLRGERRCRWRASMCCGPGVRCDPGIAAAREAARGDRVTGMAASQAEMVHEGVCYDVEVDTSRAESLDCARVIASRVV
jgi:chloramphenicol 3-O phosphotransferase